MFVMQLTRILTCLEKVYIRFSSQDVWIPVLYLSVRDTNVYSIRGIKMSKVEQLNENVKKISVEICNFRLNDTFMIRWLQSSKLTLRKSPKDIWSLDDISIYLKTNESDCDIVQDSFDNRTQRYKIFFISRSTLAYLRQ